MSSIAASNRLLMGLVLAGAGIGCATEPDTTAQAAELRNRFDLRSLGPIPYPPDNGPNTDRIALGRVLFFDPILSGERDVSCATCHHPNFAFTDGRQFAAGVSGVGLGPERTLSTSIFTGAPVSETPRNTQTVLNTAYAHNEFGQPSHLAPLFWDGRVVGLEGQALVPLTGRDEMRGDAFPGTEEEAATVAVDSIIARLRSIPEYVERFLTAFPDEVGALAGLDEEIIERSTLARAIAAYERELVSASAPYDRFVAGDDAALTDAQLEGLEIFHTKAKCFLCHASPTFGSFGYFVTGVPNAGVGKAIIPGDDTGREEHTLQASDRYAFRAPSLREVELTAPYMHSGVFETLEEVVHFYNDGARPRHANIPDEHLESALQQTLDLTDHEVASLVEFLKALTAFDAVKNEPLFTEPDVVPSGLTDRYGNAFDKVVMARITSGSWHSCAISGVGSGVPNGTAYCWGRNDSGQLGNGTASVGDIRSNPQRVLNPAPGSGIDPGDGELLRFFRLAAGDNYSCGLADGRLFCWGDNPVGRNATQPVLIEGNLDFHALAGGDKHVCALDRGGSLYCLGDNTRGQLGDGSNASTDVPSLVAGATFVNITAGASHSCGLTEDGTALCWGANDSGQLGIGTTSADVLTPAVVSGDLRFEEISAGLSHTCGLTITQEAFCWGHNGNGQLGTGTTTPETSPTPVAGQHTFSTIAAGGYHTCAANVQKTVFCWGSNESGQIGTDLALGEFQLVPDSVHTNLPFRELATGVYHTCSTSAELGFCWGGNEYGQVGNGGTNINLIPKRVIGPP